MGKRELQIKGNGGKLGLSGEKCVHMNCLMFQGKKYDPVNLLFNPLNLRAESCLPGCQHLGKRPFFVGRISFSLSLFSEMGCEDLGGAVLSRPVSPCCDHISRTVPVSTFLYISLSSDWRRVTSVWGQIRARKELVKPPGRARGPAEVPPRFIKPSWKHALLSVCYIHNFYKLKNNKHLFNCITSPSFVNYSELTKLLNAKKPPSRHQLSFFVVQAIPQIFA